MFGRKPGDEETAATAEAATLSPAQVPSVRAATPASTRRMGEMPTTRRSSTAPDGNAKKLIVGEGLALAGEITSCDILVVQGKVEAKLTDGKLLEITESGQFRGSVEIENADIAGRYDGQLVVHGRLTIRATGRISGTVKYGELEISAGGQIIGEMQVVGGGAQAAGGFKSAPRFTSLVEDDMEQPEASADRKSA